MPRARNTGANAITPKNLERLAKAGHNHTSAAKELGVPVSAFSPLTWSQALLDAGVVSKAPATEKSVRAMRADGNRWELIAVRTGLSIKDAKEMGGDEPRGLKGDNGNGDEPTTTRGRGSSKKTTAASTKKGSTRSTPKRSSKKSAAASASTPTRSRTRAARRAARSSNPS